MTTKSIAVKVDDDADEIEDRYENIPYEKRDDGWYVDTGDVDGKSEMRNYADSDARELDLRQLLLKNYDIRY